MSKIIFLDVDGVLNNLDPTSTVAASTNAITAPHLNVLKSIVDATNADIVLTSSWRLYPADYSRVDEALESVGLKCLDVTDEIGSRAAEIRRYLEQHDDIEQYVILDDDTSSFNKVLLSHCVRTTLAHGLVDSHAAAAIEILNGNLETI